MKGALIPGITAIIILSWMTITAAAPIQPNAPKNSFMATANASQPQATSENTAHRQVQRKSESEATWALVGVTGILALIGILQLVVFSKQASRLRESVIEMRAGTAAAVESAHAASMNANAMQQIERAWVTLDELSPLNEFINVPILQYPHTPRVNFKWRNSGHSPARIINAWSRLFMVELTLPHSVYQG